MRTDIHTNGLLEIGPLPGCAALGKLIDFSVPPFLPHVKLQTHFHAPDTPFPSAIILPLACISVSSVLFLLTTICFRYVHLESWDRAPKLKLWIWSGSLPSALLYFFLSPSPRVHPQASMSMANSNAAPGHGGYTPDQTAAGPHQQPL